ncbi:hypothetical protein CDL12_13653 [Handroanthus impetiginosus]|uniref:Uncharacterized protein n=1 Tax=Handroanthus impetiginosus TaxID=429701 RepID=A0A2G9H8U7_9LAMI|nr:hypothetical protein CDL12_13653 [Handroanthus impetiginosus]
MAYFKDVSPFPISHQLIILDHESQPIEKGTCLVVRTPVAGRYARPWPQLANSLYLKEWSQEISLSKTSKAWILLAAHHQHSNKLIRDQKSSSSDRDGRRLSNEDFLPTLGRQIIQGKARWGDVLQFVGEFQYIKGYWEWTEDVLNRCRHKLDAAQMYDSVYALLFTYDRNSELFISLWDLHSLAGLPLTGSLYDEVIPSFEELTGVDQTNNRIVLRSYKYLFHTYHLLRKSAIGQFSRVFI